MTLTPWVSPGGTLTSCSSLPSLAPPFFFFFACTHISMIGASTEKWSQNHSYSPTSCNNSLSPKPWPPVRSTNDPLCCFLSSWVPCSCPLPCTLSHTRVLASASSPHPKSSNLEAPLSSRVKSTLSPKVCWDLQAVAPSEPGLSPLSPDFQPSWRHLACLYASCMLFSMSGTLWPP